MVTFEVCCTTSCTRSPCTSLFRSTSLAVNANGSAAVPAGYNLASGTTYYWRAKNVDSSAASSSFSAIRSFLEIGRASCRERVNVAVVAVSVTENWMDNLQQNQILPDSAS